MPQLVESAVLVVPQLASPAASDAEGCGRGLLYAPRRSAPVDQSPLAAHGATASLCQSRRVSGCAFDHTQAWRVCTPWLSEK